MTEPLCQCGHVHKTRLYSNWSVIPTIQKQAVRAACSIPDCSCKEFVQIMGRIWSVEEFDGPGIYDAINLRPTDQWTTTEWAEPDSKTAAFMKSSKPEPPPSPSLRAAVHKKWTEEKPAGEKPPFLEIKEAKLSLSGALTIGFFFNVLGNQFFCQFTMSTLTIGRNELLERLKTMAASLNGYLESEVEL